MSLRIRRGASTDIPTPVEGELLYTKDTGKLYVGFYNESTDQVEPKLVTTQLQNETNPFLIADLDLNGNNIVGVGDINIDGVINATGNINLGDGAEDNIIVGGQISSSLVPREDSLHDLGSPSSLWRLGYFGSLTVDGNITTNELQLNKIYTENSSVLYNGDNDTLTANLVGDVTGSVLSSDSTVLVDITNNSITNGTLLFEDDKITTIQGDSINFDIGITVQSDGDIGREGVTVSGTGRAASTGSILRFNTADTSTTDPEKVPNNTVLSSLQTSAYNGISYIPGSISVTVSTDEANESYPSIPSRLLWFVGDGENPITSTQPAAFDSNGVFNAPVLQPNSYTDTEFPDSPNEGYIIFDTTNKEFKGWNGSSWVTLG